MAQRHTVLGCSDGGHAVALAVAFHNKGLRVFATARNLAKTKPSREADIESLELDVTSEESIKACVGQVSELTHGKLDFLVNNAGRD
ncbi:Oxidoreductase, short-chain dehydrogenase/reductase family [Fusarium sp. Ph1]|nr:Oxidoreductase, short-chain dehydrogenase/reductase family [Fusarium sp. Ph1]